MKSVDSRGKWGCADLNSVPMSFLKLQTVTLFGNRAITMSLVE